MFYALRYGLTACPSENRGGPPLISTCTPGYQRRRDFCDFPKERVQRDTWVPGCSSSASSLRGLRIDGRSRARLHSPATNASPAATSGGVEVAPTPIASNAATITLRRPMRSEINPAISIETASRPVLSDRVSALLAAETPKWRLNSGSSGCTV